jgi:phosphate transport system substrate-binding protein
MISIGILGMSNAQTEKGKTIIRVKGADSMSARIAMLSMLFRSANPDIEVIVEKGGLADSGIPSLLDKSADVAMVSRRLTDKEDQMAVREGVQLVERLIGYGGIVIIANPSNPLDDLTLSQVRKIFMGDIKNWKETGGPNQPITVVRTGDRHPGTVAFMRDEVLSKSSLSRKAEVVDSFPDVMRKVAATPSAIGYVRIRDAYELPIADNQKVKPLRIRQSASTVAVMPSRANLANGTYPIRRAYYLYVTTTASEDVVKFVDFIVEKGWGSEG